MISQEEFKAVLTTPLAPLNDCRGMSLEELIVQEQVLTFHVIDGKIDKQQAEQRFTFLTALLRVRRAERELDMALANLGIVAMQSGFIADDAPGGTP